MSDNLFKNIEISIDDLPQIQHGNFTTVDSRYARVLYLEFTIYFIFLITAAAVASFVIFGFLDWLPYLIILSLFTLYFLSLWFAQVSAARKQYLVRQHDVSFREGVFFQSWTTVPYSRVQHCEIAKGIIGNIFGLTELRIFTAGGSSSDLEIPGLRPEEAFKLKEIIMGKITAEDEEE